MDPRRRAWLLLPAILVISCGAIGTAIWLRSKPLSVAEQWQRMPTRQAAVLYIDFAALRRAGILKMMDASKVAEDPDYRRFAQKINLDWRTDLDSAMLEMTPSGAKYMLIGGRFDWKALRSYAVESHGECNGVGCRMEGSTQQRHISFQPMRDHLMALAVSTDDDWAVSQFLSKNAGPPLEVPDAPIWVKIPGAILRSTDDLPSGTRAFAHSVEQADSVTLMVGPQGSALEGRLDVACRSALDAAEMAGELTHVTGLLREMIEREHQKPNPGDLSGVLTSGTFRSEGMRVRGTWPIQMAFLENLLQ